MTAPHELLRERAITDTVTSTRGATVTRLSGTRRVPGGIARLRRNGRVVRRAVLAAVGWTRDTVSPAGLLLAALVVGGVVAGAAFGWFEAWVLAGISTALLLVCVPFLLGAHEYRVRLRARP